MAMTVPPEIVAALASPTTATNLSLPVPTPCDPL